ncbi:MAG TPA: DNA polymerase III subunit alpha, partial [Candidatus Saccharimonadia bacterium]|nr:DNA polymerase III subunit alpha [Candidatus Saccharimonadia bacterium]
LSSIANLEGFYYYPRIDHDLLEKYSEGLICLSGCMSGEVGDLLKQNQYLKAKKIATYYKKLFGDRYYLEIQDHGHLKNPMYNKAQYDINKALIRLSKELKIKVVVTCDGHYLKHEDQEAHEVLLCIGTGSYLSQTNRMSLKDFPLHVTAPEEIIERWGEKHPDFILNTKEIADRCKVKLEFGKILIPQFKLPKGMTEKIFLSQEVYRGLSIRYLEKKETDLEKIKKLLPGNVLERAEYELEVINRMGFNGYFLIISDFVNWGKEAGIVFGPGRGSAAGSIISYSLRITEIDPLKYDLLFERFLNPERISMPDIDIDIQDTRREEVIQYCIDKYGKDRVANIATFGRMFARNAIRDVSRVLEVPYNEADKIAKMLPQPIQGRHIPLSKTLEDDIDLKSEYQADPTIKRVIDLAIKLEGTVRNHGIHAAGIVIAPDEIVKFSPLEMAQKGVVSTQYSLGPIEELGLLKMDLLGLSNLTTINNALRIIKKIYKKDIDINDIPLDDNKTFEVFRNGFTTGIFQLESAGMKRYLKELKPNVFEDIVAMNALYRPGPMQWIDDFISRKLGKKKTEYIHPSMKPSLETTYGVVIYQEQVMQISKDMCGFTGAQSDQLRKAISKKKPEELAKMRTDFIDGAVKTVQADRSLMEKFWIQLEDFAAYCFPKSHAACYALIAYQTAYLKAHYPNAFMAALMTSDYDNTDRMAIEISECQRMKIKVLAPDINESFLEFAVVPDTNQIRFGLKAIKNVGVGAVEEIITVREKGQFTSLEDFLIRVSNRLVNKKTLESLIKTGAFDRFGDRSVLINNIDSLVAFSLRHSKQQNSGQTDLFGESINKDLNPHSKIILNESFPEVSDQEKLSWERELIGIYISEHPLSSFDRILASKTMPINSVMDLDNDSRVVIGGLCTNIKQITTKSGQKMAFAKIEDFFGDVEIILFPQVFTKYINSLEKDKVYIIKGKLSKQDGFGNSSEPKVIVGSIEEIDEEQNSQFDKKPSGKIKPNLNVNPDKKLFIKLQSSQDQNVLLAIKSEIDSKPGDTAVVLVLGHGDDKQIIKLPTGIENNESNYMTLEAIVGSENLKLY